jgi:regulatory protein
VGFGRRRITSAEAADPVAARGAAVALLARRDFASEELRARLEGKGFETGVVATTVAELLDERALNDERYAANYVGFGAAHGHGPLRISAELKALGLPAELIDATVKEGADWRALAGEVRRRKFGSEPPAEWSEKARQARFLQYRGFSSDHIRSALDADIDLD